MSRDEFVALLALLGAAFPGEERTEATVALWWAEVGHLTFPVAERAARACIRTCRWYPTLAEYVDHVEGGPVKQQQPRLPPGTAPPRPRCRTCDSLGWVFVGDPAKNIVRPCPVCRRRPDVDAELESEREPSS